MPAARFPYYRGLPTVLLSFAVFGSEDEAVRRLLVDSGFTGESSLILPKDDCYRFGQREATVNQVGGAIQGIHQRVWVSCELPELSFQSSLIAIAADVSAFSLPDGIDGLAGLPFLNQFVRWGGERTRAGAWDFVLET